ncbi:alpha/beta hydrolase [Streptomyces carminius]|uniref:Alpha/beta hydrolase n=1 Tax=Streptomyces carminius TaxID=2665496 RepID=A0A2M8LZW6_9ACTN|nr:alpha/beta hydrolase [Streptomyces carminius]PJE97479.1 alpha/beta hydrolase [Streptomyces carminius]
MVEHAEGSGKLFRTSVVTLGGNGAPERPPARAVTRTRLRAADGVGIEAEHRPYAGVTTGGGTEAEEAAPARCAIVVAHGFTGSLDRPAVRRASQALARHAAVVTFSFRGHGRSGGRSTVGDREVLDLAAAVRWARSLGYRRVATVGFSMGGSVVVRHAALFRAADGGAEDAASAGGHAAHEAYPGGTGAHTDAVVAVSAPARWYYRGTPAMRRVHWAIQHPLGRLVSRHWLRTRVHHRDWDPVPLSPVGAAPLIAPVPLLVVHGDRDAYFPLDHPRSLAAAADPAHTELWIEHGFGHAENAAPPGLLDRIGSWAAARACRPARHDGDGTTDG